MSVVEGQAVLIAGAVSMALARSLPKRWLVPWFAGWAVAGGMIATAAGTSFGMAAWQWVVGLALAELSRLTLVRETMEPLS